MRLWLPKALGRAEHEEELRNLGADQQLELLKVEHAAFNSLFREPPEGFNNAISAIAAYQGKPGALQSPNLWLYLACAYGQKHGHMKNADADAAAEARKSAIDAVSRTLQMRPGMRDLIQTSYEGKNLDQDDLASLKPDEELEQMLHRYQSPARRE